MTLAIAGMSPVLLDTTKLAVEDLQYSPDLLSVPFQHSGYEFPSVGVRPGGRPAWKFRTPFLDAYAYIGLKAKLATVCDIYFATFASGLRQAGANHTKLGLNTNCKAFCWIDGASVRQHGVLMADVNVLMLSIDSTTFPFQYVSAVSLPVLGAEPALHTLGPIGLNGVRKDGSKNHGFRNNCTIVAPINDGDKYPRNAVLMGAKPKLMIEHEDPMQMLTDLTVEGVAIPTSLALYFAGIDPTTGKRMTTGISLTGASGHAQHTGFKWSMTDPASVGIEVDLLSATSTHPIAVNTGAALL